MWDWPVAETVMPSLLRRFGECSCIVRATRKKRRFAGLRCQRGSALEVLASIEVAPKLLAHIAARCVEQMIAFKRTFGRKFVQNL